jgi:PAS domain S-box-containing protein
MLQDRLVKLPSIKEATLDAIPDEVLGEVEKATGLKHYYAFSINNDVQILATFIFLSPVELSRKEFMLMERVFNMVHQFFVIFIQWQQSENLNHQLSDVLDMAEYAFAVYNADGFLIKGNTMFLKYFSGFKSKGLFESDFLRLFGVGDSAVDDLKTGLEVSINSTKVVLDGMDLNQYFSGGGISAVYSGDKNISYYVFFLQSQKEVNRILEAMQLKELKYQRIFQHIQDVYFEVKKDGTILELSPSIYSYIKISREELIGNNILKLYHNPAQREAYLATLQSNGRVDNYEVDFIGPGGSIIHSLVVASLVDVGLESERIVGSMINISDQKEQNRIIRESEIKFRSLFDKSPIGIMICDTNGQIAEINNSMLKSLGSPSIEKTKSLNVFVLENMIQSGISKAMQEVLLTGVPKVFESKYSSIWNTVGYYRIFINTIPDMYGRVQYLMLLAEDITELKQKEKQLRQTEERFLDIYNNTNDLIYTMDFEGNFTSVNPVAEKWLGYQFSDLTNRNMGQFVSHDSSMRAAENIKAKLSGAKQQSKYEVTAYSRNGEKMILEINSFLRYKGETPIEVFGIARDITERKKHEEFIQSALRERESLIMEVHHRVKNNLQLILSMMKMYQQNFNNEQVLQAFRDIMQKILAISAVHEDFYFSNDMKDVNFNRYIRTIVNNAIDQYDTRHHSEYNIEVDNNIKASIDIAVPIGLILAELLSNGIRYGTVSGRKLIMNISFGKIDDKFVLQVEDNGPGIMPEILDIQHHSLGVEMVKMLAESQLGGQFEIETGNGGTKVIVRF